MQKDNYASFEEYLTDFYTASDKTIVDFLVKNCFIKTNPLEINNSVDEEKQSSELKHYFSIPLGCSDEAKGYGAKWDRKIKYWYVSAGTDLNPFIEKGWKRLSNEEVTTVRSEMDEQRSGLKSKSFSKKETHQEPLNTKPKKSMER